MQTSEDDVQQQVFKGMMTAGMNVRYHRLASSRVKFWDYTFRILIIALWAAAARCVVGWCFLSEGLVYSITFVELGVFVSLLWLFLPFRDWRGFHNNILELWIELHSRWERLYRRGQHLEKTDFDRELFDCQDEEAYLKQKQRSAPSKRLLKRAYREECASQGVPSQEPVRV